LSLHTHKSNKHQDLTDIYTVFHPAAAQYTFFSEAHGTSSKIDIFDTSQVLTNIKKWNDPLYIVWPQWNKTRTQQQKQLKIFKLNMLLHDEGHQRNKGGNQKVPGI
jgi:hypothetical protein